MQKVNNLQELLKIIEETIKFKYLVGETFPLFINLKTQKWLSNSPYESQWLTKEEAEL